MSASDKRDIVIANTVDAVVLKINGTDKTSSLNAVTGTNTGDNATNTTSNAYADGKVADNLTASTTVAPSKTQVNNALGLKEDLSNKDTDVTLSANSDTKYASQKATKTYVDGLVNNIVRLIGGYDASVNTFPSTGGSGTAGAIVKGDTWIISVAGTLGGQAVIAGDSIVAKVNSPAQTAGNWNILETNISYVPEDAANKDTDSSMAANSDTRYSSQKAVKTALGLKEDSANKNASGGYAGLSLFKIMMRNVANTFTSFFTNTNSAARTYTLQDRDGTIADDTDLALKVPFQLIENTQIKLPTTALTADGKYCFTESENGVLGETCAFGTILYYKQSDSKWYKARSNVVAEMAKTRLRFCGQTGNANDTVVLGKRGQIRADSLYPTFAVGSAIYGSPTAGSVVTSFDSTQSVNIWRILGYAIDANTIDISIQDNWFETGFITPSFTFGGGSTGQSYGTQKGSYHRDMTGRVRGNGYIIMSGKGSSTGQARIAGLPYAVVNDSNYLAGLSIGYVSKIKFADQIFAYALTNSTTAELYEQTNAGVDSFINDTDFDGAGNMVIIFSFDYQS